jgi:hypothetical protein
MGAQKGQITHSRRDRENGIRPYPSHTLRSEIRPKKLSDDSHVSEITNRLQEAVTVISTDAPGEGGFGDGSQGWIAGHRLPKVPMSYKILRGNP